MAFRSAGRPTTHRVIRSHERGRSNIGWLDSYHTFSFADYYNPKMQGHGSLRVINEDRVAPTEGFPTHPHHNFEIYSYVVSGALAHKDSLGNVETLTRGDVQFTSAGTGILHSEYNGSDKETVHFIQIWVKPSRSGLKPNYQTKRFTDEEKLGKLRLIVSPTGEQDSVQINQDCFTYATLLPRGAAVEHTFKDANRKGLLHVVQTGGSVELDDGTKLSAGDAILIEAGTASIGIRGTSDLPAEVLLWDLENK